MNLDSGRRRSPLRTQLRETVRSAILDAAEELIAARGLHGAALAQIARKAGVAVGSLYNYFTDREALVKALFESRRATLRPMLAAAAAAGRDLAFEPRLRRFLHETLVAYESHRRFLKVAIETEHVKMAPSTTAQDLQRVLVEIVAAGVAERVVAPAHADLLPLLVAGAIRSVVLRRTADGEPFVADADAVVSILLDGARR
ncbi:MAG: TetR/AcrR family transcriptional regulator [Kofleriaceae bacterium]